MRIQGNCEYSCKLKFKEQSIIDRNPHQVRSLSLSHVHAYTHSPLLSLMHTFTDLLLKHKKITCYTLLPESLYYSVTIQIKLGTSTQMHTDIHAKTPNKYINKYKYIYTCYMLFPEPLYDTVRMILQFLLFLLKYVSLNYGLPDHGLKFF